MTATDRPTADAGDEMADELLAEHQRNYAQFIHFAKWGTISVAVLLILMAIFLV